MGGTENYHVKRSKPDTERQVSRFLLYMETKTKTNKGTALFPALELLCSLPMSVACATTQHTVAERKMASGEKTRL
jgi:hypothetical protein